MGFALPSRLTRAILSCSQVKSKCVTLYHIDGHEFPGIALDPSVSIINHLCDPNAAYHFEGAQIHVRPLRQIAAGEEITALYTGSTAPKWILQPFLKHKWHFDCKCWVHPTAANDPSDQC
jgi:hypothetical protein